MSKSFSLKRILTFAVALTITAGMAGNGLNYTSAKADNDSEYVYEGSDSSAETENNDNDSSQNDNSSTGFDVTEYAQKLRTIAQQQAKLDDEISKADTDIKSQKKQQKILQKKIDSVNEEIQTINAYMTALEIKISNNKREIEKKKDEIEQGISDFKQRLRAMYLAGSESYTAIILESDSFYDVLMRMELLKRVASHDNDMIDNLVTLKNQYESKQKELDSQQEEYKKQSKSLTSKKKNLNKLYNSTEETKKELQRKKKALEAQNKAYDTERAQFETGLSGILKNSSGTTSRDKEIEATMAIANVKLDELHKAINEKNKKGKKLGKYEASYEFAWPVKDHYNVSSGVGARWGAYHTGLDITGPHGTPIRASDSGTVLRTNTTCTHDYGKSKSCGCGGGYGNYVIIDHGNNFITLYGHLTEVDVQPGDKIKKGEVIGKMGTTGFSTGDHLHFEIRYQGYVLNPAYYVDIS